MCLGCCGAQQLQRGLASLLEYIQSYPAIPPPVEIPGMDSAAPAAAVAAAASAGKPQSADAAAASALESSKAWKISVLDSLNK